MSDGAEVVVDRVTKVFEDGSLRALDEASFWIAAGEFVALVGSSGSGKSTLLNMIGALDVADSGTITVGGARLDELRDRAEYRAATVGFVFQFHHLIGTLNARENVEVALMGRRVPRRERQARAAALLEEVGLAGRAKAFPATLSGGERQRVAIARALANRPRLLLADEPTGSLDTATSDQILALLRGVRDQRGTTILLVTNDDHAAQAADRVLRLRDGRIAAA